MATVIPCQSDAVVLPLMFNLFPLQKMVNEDRGGERTDFVDISSIDSVEVNVI